MARYRKIDIRIWNDSKFRALDDKSKLAFFLVLTHPDTNQLGMLRSRSVALAMELGWQTDVMSDAISMLCRMGMLMVDEKAGFIFIPNFLKYNPPNGPNAVKSWSGLLDQMPECDLLNHAVASLNPFILKLSEGLQKAIPDDIKDAINNAINNAMQDDIKDAVRIQEQEQEQYISTNVDKKKNKKEKSQSLEKPEDVTDTTWNDFSLLRNKLKAPLTQTALNAIRKEAEKAGISLEDALSTCCMRGWRGFKASWLHKDNQTNRQASSGPRDLEPDWSQIDYGESGLM